MNPKNKKFEEHAETGLALPESYFVERRLAWFEKLKTELAGMKVKFHEQPNGYLLVTHKSGRKRELNTVETQIMPAAVIAQLVKQWADGNLQEDHLYRLWSPEEQIRISNKVGLKPLADKRDPQAALNNDLKVREDLRRQGFDPTQEGLT